MALMRSLMYVPSNRLNMIERASQTPADVIILDLEDSVPPAEKQVARDGLKAAIASLKAAGKTVHVRVNHPETGWTRDDLAAAVTAGLDGLAMPKTESAAQIQELDALIRDQEARSGFEPGSIGLIAHIESARAVLRCEEIAAASPRLTGLALSAFDYVADLGVQRTPEGRELEFVRNFIVHCSVAYGLVPLDTPYGDFRDEAGLVAETQHVKAMGFKGKHLIHPAQVEPVNRVFAPDAAEVEWAQRVVAAFDEAVSKGQASVQMDGRMIDTAIARRARDILAVATPSA